MENNSKLLVYKGIIQYLLESTHYTLKNIADLSRSSTFSAIFDNTFKKIKADKNEHILYKIVDIYIEKDMEYFKCQCSYSKAVLHLTIQDIVFNLDILHGLHPMQGCFIGVEYATVLKSSANNPKLQKKQHHQLNTYPICRYGSHNLLYQDRKGYVGFECRDNDEQFLMDPRDIALSRELIEEFDAAQAFYIGVWAGLKFANPIINAQEHNKKRKFAHLQLVK